MTDYGVTWSSAAKRLSQYQVSWSSHCWVNTRYISFSDKTNHEQHYLVYVKTYKSSSNMEHVVCVNMREERLGCNLYFDAVHRCSTDRNVSYFNRWVQKKKKLNGKYSLIELPVIHLMQYTYPVDAVDTVHTVKVHRWFRFFALLVKEIPKYRKCQNWYIDILGSS